MTTERHRFYLVNTLTDYVDAVEFLTQDEADEINAEFEDEGSIHRWVKKGQEY
ncbi:MAG: hypothetical protein AAF609_12545 [Cyanobacteria bacterium P01_C01_bin.120]